MSLTSFPEVSTACCWRPRTDLYRGPRGWLAKLDLAGVRPEDVKIDLQGHKLQIRGVRRDVRLDEGWRHYALEIEYSRFERVIELPGKPRVERITVQWRDGMLLVQIFTSPRLESP